MFATIKNPFFLFVVSSMFLGLVLGKDDSTRAKRGAAVYVTFPSGGIRPHVEKNPQDFINAVGANNNGYAASNGYGGGLLAQYQQSSYGSPSGGGGHGSGSGGGGGSYGRRKRNVDTPQQNHFNFEYNPYHSFEIFHQIHMQPPSWSSTQNLETSYPNRIADIDDTPPFPLHLPNPVIVDGLLEAATSSNNAQHAVFRAYTARTPYYGLNGSFEMQTVPSEESNNVTFNS